MYFSNFPGFHFYSPQIRLKLAKFLNPPKKSAPKIRPRAVRPSTWFDVQRPTESDSRSTDRHTSVVDRPKSAARLMATELAPALDWSLSGVRDTAREGAIVRCFDGCCASVGLDAGPLTSRSIRHERHELRRHGEDHSGR